MIGPGYYVRLRAYGGEEIIRRVVAVKPGVVLVCKDEEYAQAQREGREPAVVGFRLEHVIEEQP